jgi:hypothetical protein
MCLIYHVTHKYGTLYDIVYQNNVQHYYIVYLYVIRFRAILFSKSEDI